MAGGTFAWFSGYPLVACSYACSRGWSATTSTVELLSLSAPAGTAEFSVNPGLDAVYSHDPPASPTPREPRKPLAVGAYAAGYLVIREEDGEGTVYTLPPVGPLLVIRAETVKHASGSALDRIRLTLADVRYLAPRGLLERWSFNRVLLDGSIARDSIKPDGTPFSRAEVAKLIAHALPWRADLTTYPERWNDDHAAIELPRFASAVQALAVLAHPAGLEDPCLRLDGKLELRASGDGLLGFDDQGKANSVPFPARSFPALDKQGTGKGRVVEPSYAEEWIVVVGGERIFTVAVDDWDPVLVLPGNRVELLTEALVRKLTDGAFGLDWLKRFVLRPAAYRSNPKLDPDVADLFSEQAWRYYRMPLVEIPDPEAPDVAIPGPNAHLLPLLHRAELVNGRRAAPAVEAYGFRRVHVALRGSPGQLALSALVEQISKLRAGAPRRSTIDGVLPRGRLTASDLLRDDPELARGIGVGEIDAALARVREIQSYDLRAGDKVGANGLTGKAFAKLMLELTRKQLQAETDAGGPAGRVEVFDVAVKLFEAEAKIEADLGITEGATDRSADVLREALAKREGIRLALVAEVQDLLTAAERARKDYQDRVATQGGAATGEVFGLEVYGNVPPLGRKRREDPGAVVIDAEAGIVRTSGLAGSILPDGVSDLRNPDARFVPRPVRVRFGTVMRPRIDLSPGEVPTVPRSVTGDDPRTGKATPEADNVIPEGASDRETYFTAAFKRVARGAPISVPLESVPLERAVRIDHQDLVELVGLDGRSNADDLTQRAANEVAERFNVPETVETKRLVLSRPWPVSCDGVVSSVEINMRIVNGAPCGFETIVTCGSQAARVDQQPVTREHPRRPRGGRGATRTGAIP